MLTNTVWNKQDIENIISILSDHSAIVYKDLIFINAFSDESDILQQYLTPIAGQAGGASAIALRRSIIASSNAQYPAEISRFVLSNSKETDDIVPVIVIIRALFKEKHRNRLPFIIAHELSHVLDNDHMPEQALTQGSQEDLTREIKADKFANDLLGSTDGGIDTISFILEQVKDPAHEVPVEIIEAVTTILASRLDCMLKNSIKEI